MIEYVSKQGGRHLYNEDMINLQNLINSFPEFFKDCGEDFVISGLEQVRKGDGWYFDEGYVFLDGKVRYVPSVSTKYSYIIPHDTNSQDIVYATPGITGPIYKEYGVKFATSDQYNDIKGGHFIGLFIERSLELNFFGHYSILKKYRATNNVLKSDADFAEIRVNNEIDIDNIIYSTQSAAPSNSPRLNASKPWFFEDFANIRIDDTNRIICTSTSDEPYAFVYDPYTLRVSKIDADNLELLDFIGENDEDNVVRLPAVDTKDVAVPVLRTKSMSLKGVPIDTVLRRKNPNTGWLKLQNTDNLVCKQVYKDVYITGRLPFYDLSAVIKSTENINDYCIKKQSSVKLPDGISLPPSNTIFNVRGGNHCLYNGSADLYFDSDGYLCMEVDMRNKFVPNPSSVFWHYIVD